MDIYLNGDMLPPDQARVEVLDAGFQHAVGLFETMSAYFGQVFQLERHLDRLDASAQELGLSRGLDRQALRSAVQRTLQHNGIEDRARLRLTITGGDVSLLRPPSPEAAGQPEPLTTVIVPSEPIAYDPGYFSQGITVLIAPPAANPFDPMQGYKTLNYWGRLRTLRQAASVGAGEAIWMQISNHLASGSISNVFLVKDGELLTPIARGEEAEGAMRSPVLPGTTRAAVLELAAEAGLNVKRQMLSIDELLGADEVFLTNASWLVLPVTKVERAGIGEGQVGPVTIQLREALVKRIVRDLGPDSDASAGGGNGHHSSDPTGPQEG